MARQWTVKKERKIAPAGLDQSLDAQSSAENCASFVTERLALLRNRKKVSVLILLSCSFSVLYPGSEVLWCEIHWNFHGLWVWMRPHTFHIHESIIAIVHFIMSSRSPPQVYYFFFFEAAALRLAHIVTLKVDYQTDFARTWSRFLQHRFGSRRKCFSWQRARFLIESSQPAGDYVQLNLVWFLSSNTQLASETDCCLTVTTSRLIRSIRQFHLPTRTFYCVDDGVK